METGGHILSSFDEALRTLKETTIAMGSFITSFLSSLQLKMLKTRTKINTVFKCVILG